MNPRSFCREQSYHKALLLTYSFDPVFFEQVILSDLWVGRSSDILVLADASQLESAMAQCSGQLWHLGKRYLLSSVNHASAFHPKVFLRLGPDHGLIMIGTGNLTSSGWGGNQELGAAWKFGPRYDDNGSWLFSFLDRLAPFCEDELQRDFILRAKDLPWVSPIDSESAPTSVIFSQPEVTLASQLADRWQGLQFEELRLLTGSTDDSGQFLRWAHTEFGVQRATVCCTESSISFVSEKLADLTQQMNTSIENARASMEQATHASKSYEKILSKTEEIVGELNDVASTMSTLTEPISEAASDFKKVATEIQEISQLNQDATAKISEVVTEIGNQQSKTQDVWASLAEI